MSVLNPTTTVGELVAERPSRARIFEKHGIDYCCGGRKPLHQACTERGIETALLLQDLTELDAQPDPSDRDWTAASLTELADDIERTHHDYLRRELPRLGEMIAKVARVHGANHPEMLQVDHIFRGFRDELDSHMMKEERVLFPMIRELESSEGPLVFHCGSIGNPIRMMEFEHEHAGDALATMRQLTHGYVPPEGVCNTYRATLDGLAELEQDMHRHVHKENSILFPRAAKLEASRQGGVELR